MPLPEGNEKSRESTRFFLALLMTNKNYSVVNDL
jgi:hypothetical protein